MAGMARRRRLPVAQPLLRDRLCGGAGSAAGQRGRGLFATGFARTALVAAAEQSSADRIKRLTAEAKIAPGRPKRPAATSRKIPSCGRSSSTPRTSSPRWSRAQTQKHLSQEQQRFLIEALRPFAGQKVSIASIRGDDEGQQLAQEFVSVFEAAGWDHHGEAGVIDAGMAARSGRRRGRAERGRCPRRQDPAGRRRADQRGPQARPRLRQHRSTWTTRCRPVRRCSRSARSCGNELRGAASRRRGVDPTISRCRIP